MLAHEPILRLTVFLSLLAFLALAEAMAPRRRREIPRAIRWSNHLALVVIDTLLVRLTLPIAAVGMALVWQANGWGLLNLIALPGWIEFAAALLILDLAIYGQHILFHMVPVLWRLHRVHHADVDFDVTTGIRFHPVEILLSTLIKLAVVAVIGPPAAAVLLFEITLNATALFSHSNLHLAGKLDAALRLLVVTPDMHRVHHSVHPEETNSNYGFNLAVWDRLFGTYRAQPQDGHTAMRIGLNQFRSPKDSRFDRLLIQPLVPPDA